MVDIPKPKLPPTPKKVGGNIANMCLIHKGPLQGDVYTCKCGAKMCKSCAIERKQSATNRLCPKCSSILFVKE